MEPLKVIVVEDDMIIQMFIVNVLQKAGFEVIGEARKGDEVLKILANSKPDLILMDIGLAGDKDGIETAEIINKKLKIPIIFITGNSDEFTHKRAKATNPIEIFFKPIDEERLKKRLLDFKKWSNQ